MKSGIFVEVVDIGVPVAVEGGGEDHFVSCR